MLGRRFKRGRGRERHPCGPVLPERARSECARSTCAVGPLRVPFPAGRSKCTWREKDKWPGALLARGTRALRRASFDARSRGLPRPLPLVDGWSSKGYAAWSSSCSRNAHDQNVLARCAQERAALATPLSRRLGQRGEWRLLGSCARTTRGRGLHSLDRRSGRPSSPPSKGKDRPHV